MDGQRCECVRPAVTTKKKGESGGGRQEQFESDYLIHFLLFSKTLKEIWRPGAGARRIKGGSADL